MTRRSLFATVAAALMGKPKVKSGLTMRLPNPPVPGYSYCWTGIPVSSEMAWALGFYDERNRAYTKRMLDEAFRRG